MDGWLNGIERMGCLLPAMLLETGIRLIAGADDPPWFAARTRRSLPAAPPAEGRWLIRAGCWLPRRSAEGFIPATGTAPCVLIGCTLADPAGLPHGAWLDLLRGNSGVFRPADAAALPPVHSLWMNEAALAGTGVGVENDDDMPDLRVLAGLALERGWAVIRHAPLDVCQDLRPRLLQVITSLQRGGAERLVLDQHEALPGHGIGTRLLTLGSPCRDPFPVPPGTLEMRLPPDAAIRAAAIAKAVHHTGADVVHAHLVDGETLCGLDPELPLMVTFHNQRPGWPEAIDRLAARPQTLLIGCSQAVTGEIQAAFPGHLVRTLWNGITAPLKVERTTSPGLRLVAIANPRPQKRLPFLMEVLAVLVRLRPGVSLKVAGQASSVHADAQEEVRLCQEKMAAYGLDDAVEWLGAVADVPALLAQADVLVSTSLHEGLSLAQLEALACGLQVVATEVGGAGEIAARHPGRVRLLPVGASAEDFAKVLAEMAPGPAWEDGRCLAADFTTPVMAARHAWLVRSHLGRIPPDAKRRGLVLITNNFSTGGAQSSARRLLLKLRDLDEEVRAVVLQEEPGHPTPGRAALTDAGLEVLALNPPEVCEAATALAPLLPWLAQAPPEAVLFWNVIPEYKLLLAEALHPLRVFDVSPGEMFFASLDRYFMRPRAGLPVLDARAYGLLLAGVIVKHDRELALAGEVLQTAVHLIPNGVAAGGFKPEPPAAAWVIGTAARLHPHKRLEDLIAAFRLVHARHPQARLRMAGGPDFGQEAYADALRESTQDLGAAVEWCGEMTDIAAFHDGLCVFAMISEPVGCPNASLEAMASCLPVVATAVGGANQQVDPGITGFLLPARDAEAFAEALLRLLEDEPLRERMRRAAYDRVESCFSLDGMAARYREICLGR